MAKARPGRLTGKAARRNSVWRKPRTLIIVGVLALAVSGAGATAIVLDDDASAIEATPADEWRDQILQDLAGASQSTLDYVKVINDWTAGKQTDEQMSAAADRAFQNYTEAREILAEREPFEKAPRALENFRDSMELFTETTRLAKLGAGISAEALREQIKLQVGRVRQLGDRFYDLGSAEIEPHRGYQRPELDSDEFQFIRVPEVPSFAGTNLAAGPPLTNAKPAAAQVRKYQEVRPEQEFAAWLQTVERADIPTATEQVEALNEGDADALGALADRLTAASDLLYNSADPRDLRNLNTRIQLGLLVQAEAMRAGQIAALLDKDAQEVALNIAQTLALIGNRVWDPRLGPRPIDLPATLLERVPV